MHVDGFRFDLASVFSRDSEGNVNLQQPPLFDQIASDPDLANVRLIAEPWDAAGLYQLGCSFPGQTWMKWNGSYRDTLQRFVRGEVGMVPDLMTRLYGSSDLFPDHPSQSFRPFQIINYIASHDGSTISSRTTTSTMEPTAKTIETARQSTVATTVGKAMRRHHMTCSMCGNAKSRTSAAC